MPSVSENFSRCPRHFIVELRIAAACLAALAPLIAPSLALSAEATTPPVVRMENESDCFRFPSYDGWREFIKKRSAANKDFSLVAFENRYPQQLYDDSRRTLTCSFFRYSIDGVPIGGFAAWPKASDTADRKTPVVIYNHGGSGESSAVNFAEMMDQVFPLAAQGFLVIGTQYRQKDEFGGKDVEDVTALLQLIDQRTDVDHERIGMMGWSRGGIMTVLATAASHRVKAIAIGATPADLYAGLASRPDMENVYRRLIPDYATRAKETLEQRSPLLAIDKLDRKTPVLILQGSADTRVPAKDSLAMAGRLQDLGMTYKLIIYPNGDHGLSTFREDVHKQLSMWFRTYLSGEQPPR